MKELIKDTFIGMPLGMYLILIVVAALLITAFFLPPMAVIHKSVLYAAAELIGGGWLYYVTAHIPEFISKGAKIRAQKGDAMIEISKDDDTDNNTPITQ